MDTPDPFKEAEEAILEVNETLPIEPQEESQEEPQEQEDQQNPDYLDDFNKQNQQQHYNSAPVMFDDGTRDDNLVKWQLGVDWTRIEHIIRGHKPVIDNKTGDESFEVIKGHYLNEKGVNQVLHFLSFYLSKEIFLAAFTAEQADLRVKQFSHEFTNFVYDNLNELGMDTAEKAKMSKMLVLNVVNLVDAAYSRAIEGQERESLRKTTHISQNEPLHQLPPPQESIMPRRGLSRMFT